MGSGTADARAACDDRRWGDAWRTFQGAPPDTLDVDDLDRFATAAYLTGHDEDGFSLWGRAHQRCVEEGTVHRAAHFGMRLAECLAFKGDLPRTRGWVDRTTHLLEDADIDCVEQGYLEHAIGMCRLFEDGDIAGALAHFERAQKVAARFGDRELRTLGRIGAGRMMIYLGELAGGVALLDEAMVSIEAGELSPLATGDAYCTVIDACAELSDVRRCRAWTASMQRWCDTHQELVLYRGHCFIHSAEVLQVQGRWPEALVAARQACDRLAAPLPAALGAAAYLEADVLRLLGDTTSAEAAYLRANELGFEPQPGLALLLLSQGKVEAADAMIRRVAGQLEGPVFRSRMLGALAEIALAAGDVAAARDAVEELRGLAGELGSPKLRADAARVAGMVLLTEGDASAAMAELRQAFRGFGELGAQPDAARARALIAVACDALGDVETARIEREAARSAIASFSEASPDGDATADLAGGDLPDGLTERELDVLRLLAQGKTNRVIGAELFISEKTVASHVSHIFTKLGVASRAAATAYAYDRKLV